MDNQMKKNDVAVTEKTQDKKETRQQKKAERKQKRLERKERRAVHRMFPIWLRIIVVVVLSVLAVILGLLVGYGILGGSEEPFNVLTFDFWQHIIDIITGVE